MPPTKKTEDREEGPRAFARVLEQLNDGEAHRDLSAELFELVGKLQEEALARDSEVKGELSLKAVAVRRELAKRGADCAHALATAVRKDAAIAAGVALELALVKGRDDIGSRTPTLAGEILEALEIDVSEVRGEVKRDLDKRDEAEAAKRGQGRVRKRRARKGEQTELQSEAAGEEVAS